LKIPAGIYHSVNDDFFGCDFKDDCPGKSPNVKKPKLDFEIHTGNQECRTTKRPAFDLGEGRIYRIQKIVPERGLLLLKPDGGIHDVAVGATGGSHFPH
jgi:hypothetical protein